MKIINKILPLLLLIVMATACQKMHRPALGDYPKDASAPGGPLKFYTAFDGTTADPLMNAVDSVRANFPSDNPFTTVDGPSGKAVKGVAKKFIKYAKPNDWAATAKSFTISYWYTHDGQTTNNKGTNGPEYIFSFKSNNGHWSGASFLLFMEGNNTSGQIKMMIVDKKNADSWMTWEGAQSISGLMDNKWHHVVLVYNASNSTTTLYLDGVANPNTKIWAGHGDVNLDDGAITEFRVGCGPNSNVDSDDWLASSWKGNIDQLRLYSTALTAAEASALFSGKK